MPCGDAYDDSNSDNRGGLAKPHVGEKRMASVLQGRKKCVQLLNMETSLPRQFSLDLGQFWTSYFTWHEKFWTTRYPELLDTRFKDFYCICMKQ